MTTEFNKTPDGAILMDGIAVAETVQTKIAGQSDYPYAGRHRTDDGGLLIGKHLACSQASKRYLAESTSSHIALTLHPH